MNLLHATNNPGIMETQPINFEFIILFAVIIHIAAISLIINIKNYEGKTKLNKIVSMTTAITSTLSTITMIAMGIGIGIGVNNSINEYTNYRNTVTNWADTTYGLQLNQTQTAQLIDGKTVNTIHEGKPTTISLFKNNNQITIRTQATTPLEEK